MKLEGINVRHLGAQWLQISFKDRDYTCHNHTTIAIQFMAYACPDAYSAEERKEKTDE